VRPYLLIGIVFSLPLASLFVACDSSGSSTTASATTSEPVATTAGTTTAAAPAPPPPLTHRQFIRQLDHLCKIGNRATKRRFEDFGAISDTAASMDAFADWLVRVNRYVRKWDRRHGFFELNPGDESDVRAYERYKALTKQLRIFSRREVLAARRHDFDELRRLFDLEDRVRNRRTRQTARMGLVICGA
jgi:hypothetical protein